jgi:PKD repeat protein
MQSLRTTLAAAALAAAATAQFAVVIPDGYANIGENTTGNAFPFGTTGTTYTGLRIQQVYDSSNFTNQQITFPVLITGLRFRAAHTATTWAGGSYTNAVVQLSTAPIDHAAATTNWATNHGLDLATVYTGPVTVQGGTGNGAGTPGPFHVDIPFPTTPFLYDPSLGDLVIDTDVAMPGTGGFATLANVSGTGVPVPQARRVYASTLYPNANGVDQNILVLEVQYTPAAGLYPGFTSDVRTGASPLTVNFQDNSYSSDPLGVLTWAWDFDGDSVIDSTAQNPSFTYNTCGSYDVSLTVVDATHGVQTVTRSAYIVTDRVTPDFSFTQVAPNVFAFTDLSTPTPTTWAWDLDGDSVVDDTTQNPVFFYPNPCTGVNVTLTASRLCGPSATVGKQIVLSPNTLLATNQGGNGTTSATWVGNVFDAQVTNPDGVNICALSVRPYNFAGPFNVQFYASSGSYLDIVGTQPRYAVPSAWRLLATGTGVSSNTPFGTAGATLDFVTLSNNVYLPAGDYTLAVFVQNPAGTAGVAYTNGPVGPISDGNMTVFVGAQGRAVTSLFGTGGFTPRMWNGAFHYGTWSGTGEAGLGFAGLGCAGTLATSQLTSSGDPVLGSTITLTANNLPLSAMILVTGLSAPAPVDLTPFGAPGCLVRAALDATSFRLGAGNSASWNITVPANPAFSGLRLWNQVLALDPTANALGAVTSDAVGMIVGN